MTLLKVFMVSLSRWCFLYENYCKNLFLVCYLLICLQQWTVALFLAMLNEHFGFPEGGMLDTIHRKTKIRGIRVKLSCCALLHSASV